jgi:hypothetical protein
MESSNIWYYISMFNLAGVVTMFLYHHTVKHKLQKLHKAYEALAHCMEFDVVVLYTMNANILQALDMTPEELAKNNLPNIFEEDGRPKGGPSE